MAQRERCSQAARGQEPVTTQHPHPSAAECLNPYPGTWSERYIGSVRHDADPLAPHSAQEPPQEHKQNAVARKKVSNAKELWE